MTDGQEINMLKLEVAALKQQLHALIREQCQIDLLTKDKRISELMNINVEHQKLNGELREDNKKLARQIDDYTNQLRKAGVI